MELPLSQPPQPTPPSSAANTLRTSSCPGTPEMQRRKEEAVKRLAAKVQLPREVTGPKSIKLALAS